jgi:poly(A) polymerase
MHGEPLIIPRPEHAVSRRSLSPNALKTLYRLRDNGFTAFLVGGCVRDFLLGREPKDFDVVTDATPGQVKRLFRNCRLVGRRFRLAHLHFGDEIIEVATFRSAQPELPGDEESGDRPPRHLVSEEGVVLRDNVFGTPEEDALRRDFTVNALFYNIADFSIIDYVGGMEDMRHGVIRTIGAPRQRFIEDPVRMARAVRFAALLGFEVEEVTWQALLELAPTITRSTPPRLYEEILKLFLQGEAEASYQLLRRTGLLAALFPRFNAWLETETAGFPHVWVGKALDLVDDRRGAGEEVPPHVLLALLFGQYLEEKGECFRAEGASPQQATDMAMAEFLEETVTTVLIPHRVALMVRQILAIQHRFRKTPGRHPLSFVARPGFGDALAYLRFRAEVTGEGRELCTWWERFVREHPLPQQQEDSEAPEQSPRRKRKRRRGRGKPREMREGPGSNEPSK